MCGSGSDPCWNRVTANYGTVGGGYANIASGYAATVGGGQANHATGTGATIGGGGSAPPAARPPPAGGAGNTAGGDYSFAAGYRAKATHQGSFVWGDSTNADISSTADNQFVARASGGVTLYTNSTLTAGVSVAAGGGSWSSVSDRALKENCGRGQTGRCSTGWRGCR